MDATPSLREQGMQALQQGRIDQAIDLLARAVMADDRDADAKAILGVAYSQKGLHAQAKRALQTAVELQPQNPSFRYNLGIVLERSGEMQGAAIAYRDTLQINKDHAQARAKLQAMGPQAHAYLANAPRPPAAEQFGAGAPPMHASGYPDPTQAGPPSAGPAPSMGQPPGYANPSMPAPPPIMEPGYGGPGLAHHGGPPGTVQCPNCREYSRPGLSCEFCSASLKPPSPQTSSAHSVPPPVVNSGAYASGGSGVFGASSMGAGEAFFRRFAAMFIDNILVSIVGFALAVPFGFAVGVSVAGLGRELGPGDTSMLNGIGVAIQVLVNSIYYGTMYSLRGQSLGKMALGLRIVGPDGGNPSFVRSALRETVGKWLSSCLCLVGFFWMLWDSEQQALHDKLCGTQVERA